MARLGVEAVDTAEGTVSAAPAGRGLVDLDVRDHKVLDVQALGVGIGTSVLKKVGDELHRLDGPAGLGDTELLALGSAANVAVVLAERNGTLLLGDGLEVLEGSCELLTRDGLSSGLGVLVAHAEVRAARGRNRGRVHRSLTVTSHVQCPGSL